MDSSDQRSQPGSAGGDEYGRRAVSTSRGKTHDRILAMQRADGTLPGADELLANAPAGSLGAGILAFLADWVVHRSITSRRAYERSLTLLARDCAEHGPPLDGPSESLTRARIGKHLAWRVDGGLNNPAELIRCAVHLARLSAWMDMHHGTAVNATREALREMALKLIDEHELADTDAGIAPTPADYADESEHSD